MLLEENANWILVLPKSARLLCKWGSVQALLCQAPKYVCDSQEKHSTESFTDGPKIHSSDSTDSNLKVGLSSNWQLGWKANAPNSDIQFFILQMHKRFLQLVLPPPLFFYFLQLWSNVSDIHQKKSLQICFYLFFILYQDISRSISIILRGVLLSDF